MTTNYGERPGMEAQPAQGPRTMIRGRSRDGSKVIVSDSRTRTIAQFYGPDRDANSELFMQAEAERAAHAETLAALEGMVLAAVETDGDVCASGCSHDMCSAIKAARAAIALAKGGRS